MFVLESPDTGSWYVADWRPVDRSHFHQVKTTAYLADAASFSTRKRAQETADAIPGRWIVREV